MLLFLLPCRSSLSAEPFPLLPQRNLFFAWIKLELEEEDDDSDITTVSGFAAHNLEKIPDEGDIFQHRNLKITITKTDSNRVVEAEIEVLEKGPSEEEQ